MPDFIPHPAFLPPVPALVHRNITTIPSIWEAHEREESCDEPLDRP